jgi:hypothetical protein
MMSYYANKKEMKNILNEFIVLKIKMYPIAIPSGYDFFWFETKYFSFVKVLSQVRPNMSCRQQYVEFCINAFFFFT